MSSASVSQETRTVNFGTEEPDLVHLFCGCQGRDAKTARCGKEKETWEAAEEREPICLVCEDLSALPCPLCGKVAL